MSSSIDELQRRVAELQNLGFGGTPSSPTTVKPPLKEDLRSLVREVMLEELESMKNSTIGKPVPEPEPVEEVKPELDILSTLDKILDSEDKKFLSRADVLKQVDRKLVTYLQTGNGRAAVKDFITYFKGFYEN